MEEDASRWGQCDEDSEEELGESDEEEYARRISEMKNQMRTNTEKVGLRPDFARQHSTPLDLNSPLTPLMTPLTILNQDEQGSNQGLPSLVPRDPSQITFGGDPHLRSNRFKYLEKQHSELLT